MIKVLFVCLGNICRSAMAEYIFKDMVEKLELTNNFHIESRATSTEEIGNGMHYGTRRKLEQEGIKYTTHKAKQLTYSDYENYDYIIGMENSNIRNINRIIKYDKEHKVTRLLDFSNNPRDIDDPWYTGNFDKTYEDIIEGCRALLQHILKNSSIKNNLE